MAGMTLQEIMAAQMEPLDTGGPVSMPQGAPQGHKMNWGAILADALSGLAGQQGQYPQRVAREREQQNQQAQEEANWGRRLQNYEAQKQIDQRYDTPAVSPMERDLNYWRSLDPAGQDAYRTMQAAKPQFIPDGMGGGQWAAPPSSAPSMPRPVGKLTPINGGPTPQASGGFPR